METSERKLFRSWKFVFTVNESIAMVWAMNMEFVRWGENIPQKKYSWLPAATRKDVHIPENKKIILHGRRELMSSGVKSVEAMKIPGAMQSCHYRRRRCDMCWKKMVEKNYWRKKWCYSQAFLGSRASWTRTLCRSGLDAGNKDH